LAERNPDAQIFAMELHPRRAALMRKLVPTESVDIVAADARKMPFATKFDRILVDAPCSGTGTLARNPEIKWRLKEEDLFRLQKYQLEILSAAVEHLAPGGRVVYSTCSLEPEENEHVVNKVLEHDRSVRIIDCALELRNLQANGELAWKDLDSLLSGPFLRTIPGAHPCDGFFAAILGRSRT
jgi:16S rRNA (cytosine967-C5)-methyltransferase